MNDDRRLPDQEHFLAEERFMDDRYFVGEKRFPRLRDDPGPDRPRLSTLARVCLWIAIVAVVFYVAFVYMVGIGLGRVPF